MRAPQQLIRVQFVLHLWIVDLLNRHSLIQEMTNFVNRADTRAGSVFVTVQYLFHVIVEVRILSAEDIARFLAVSVRCSAREKQRRFSYPMLVSNDVAGTVEELCLFEHIRHVSTHLKCSSNNYY